MRDFTFITYTFNHEEYIVEHLESIKFLIITYGGGIDFNYILIDDASRDNTQSVVSNWIEENRELFSNVDLIFKHENKGTVDSVCIGLEKTKTKCFKALAGDDYYYTNNLFELYNNIEKKIVTTPCILIGDLNNSASQFQRKNYKLLKFMGKNANRYMKWRNVVPAPGVFWESQGIDISGLTKYLDGYRLIEDYPMWCFLIEKYSFSIEILDKPYICYRIGSGVSSTKPNEYYLKDIEKIVRELKPKAFDNSIKSILHKIILKIMQIFADLKYSNYKYPEMDAKKIRNKE